MVAAVVVRDLRTDMMAAVPLLAVQRKVLSTRLCVCGVWVCVCVCGVCVVCVWCVCGVCGVCVCV